MSLLLESQHSYEIQTVCCYTRQRQIWLRQQPSYKISEMGFSPTSVARDSELLGCYAVPTGKFYRRFEGSYIILQWLIRASWRVFVGT